MGNARGAGKICIMRGGRIESAAVYKKLLMRFNTDAAQARARAVPGGRCAPHPVFADRQKRPPEAPGARPVSWTDRGGLPPTAGTANPQNFRERLWFFPHFRYNALFIGG